MGDKLQIGNHLIKCGDLFEFLKTLEENSIDSVVTDPPYGWRFMGKAWDVFDIEKGRKSEFQRPPRKDGKSRGQGDPSLVAGSYDLSNEANQNFQSWTEGWAKEALRVLKPGGHMLAFCGPRTYHRMASGVEDAGFEIRDQLQWLFGSGFPKSLNLGNGFGTGLKPANEPILLARKPISESTIAKNVQKWGTGGINIDGCRISGAIPVVPNPKFNSTGQIYNMKTGEGRNGEMSRPEGRFPANLILDETAAEMLDEQSAPLMHSAGKTRSGGKAIQFGEGGLLAMGNHDGNGVRFGDSGGASRFFYVAKASKSERNAGLEGALEQRVNGGRQTEIDNPFQRGEILRQNTHPTVKPIKLIQYLVRLITPPNGLVLDCFLGSGTTAIACEREGFRSVGCELDPAYFNIIIGRIEESIRFKSRPK